MEGIELIHFPLSRQGGLHRPRRFPKIDDIHPFYADLCRPARGSTKFFFGSGVVQKRDAEKRWFQLLVIVC